ncbi:hypothetical protein ADK52_25375 [Streptomyces sp. WM6372]|uniref:hypothetical protein n=1 Tax=Streptomyces sp. WM6372 TaxID=1415555 RepID=UPI0006AFE256|nr:hypothetical protein [Streptomyces sp. WM6372]KOU20925.1 hypothetical protein ADK52_25375 [Streptomyces sp. WM6372]
MSPAEAAWATVVVTCAAVWAAYRFLCWLLDRKLRRLRQRELRVARDLEVARLTKTRREFARIIAAEFPADIPHQTRRTEDNQ